MSYGRFQFSPAAAYLLRSHCPLLRTGRISCANIKDSAERHKAGGYIAQGKDGRACPVRSGLTKENLARGMIRPQMSVTAGYQVLENDMAI